MPTNNMARSGVIFPNEVLRNIFDNLPLVDLGLLEQVNVQFRLASISSARCRRQFIMSELYPRLKSKHSWQAYPYRANLLFWLRFRLTSLESVTLDLWEDQFRDGHTGSVLFCPAGSEMYWMAAHPIDSRLNVDARLRSFDEIIKLLKRESPAVTDIKIMPTRNSQKFQHVMRWHDYSSRQLLSKEGFLSLKQMGDTIEGLTFSNIKIDMDRNVLMKMAWDFELPKLKTLVVSCLFCVGGICSDILMNFNCGWNTESSLECVRINQSLGQILTGKCNPYNRFLSRYAETLQVFDFELGSVGSHFQLIDLFPTVLYLPNLRILRLSASAREIYDRAINWLSGPEPRQQKVLSKLQTGFKSFKLTKVMFEGLPIDVNFIRLLARNCPDLETLSLVSVPRFPSAYLQPLTEFQRLKHFLLIPDFGKWQSEYDDMEWASLLLSLLTKFQHSLELAIVALPGDPGRSFVDKVERETGNKFETTRLRIVQRREFEYLCLLVAGKGKRVKELNKLRKMERTEQLTNFFTATYILPLLEND